MMKKTLFLMSALLLTGIGASAQTSSHECVAEVDHWTIKGNTNGDFHYNDWSTEADASGMVVPFLEYWVGSWEGNLSAATISHEQLKDLSEGYYEVSMDIRIFSEAGNAIGKGTTFSANGVSEDLDAYGHEGTYGTETEVYDTYRLLVYVTADTLDISLTIPESATYNWISFKNLEVTYLGATAPVGYNAHGCTADVNHWSISGNSGGSFQRNTWSTEADPSGMTTPFIEYWVGAGSALSDATISHETLTDLTEGYYEVSIFARAFNENSLVDVSQGIVFNAGNTTDGMMSIDLNKGTHATYDHVSAEEYGTYKVYCEVDETGTLDINFTLESVNCDWLAFKNLDVAYCGTALTDLPELTAATGTMNKDIAAAQTTALSTYETTATLANYNAAYQAVECARFSAEFYASVAAFVETLDEAGETAFKATTNGAAYTSLTLDYCDMSETYATAQKAQTTNNTDWSYVLKNTGTWVNAISATNFQQCPSLSTAHEVWSASAWSLPDGFTAADAIIKRIEDLPAGTYTISFYAYGSELEDANTRPLAFANNSLQINVAYASALAWNESSLYTMNCTVNASGELNFGMKTQGDGNWYVIEECSLTLVALAEIEDTESEYEKGDAIEIDGETYYVQCDNMVENHSFELGFTGWTDASNFTTVIIAENFDLRSNAQDGSVCLVGTTNAGISGTGSLGKAWEIETGKTYYFSYYVKNLTTNTGLDTEYLKTSLTSSPGSETSVLGYPTSVGSDWQKVEYKFDNESYAYVQVDFRWLNNQWAFDNFQLYEIEEATEIEWTLGAEFGTLILPFDYDLSNTGLTAYTGEISGDVMELTPVSGNKIETYTPYIIGGGTEAQTTYTFSGVPGTTEETTFTDSTSGLTGVLEATTVTSGNYVLQNQNGTTAFYLVEDGTAITCGAYHCYLDRSAVSGVKSITFTFGDDVATRIDAVETEETANEAIYDLSGRRVAKAQKGVYIVNGKKMVIK